MRSVFPFSSRHLLVLRTTQRCKKLAIFGTMGGDERKVEGLSLWGRRDRVREGVGCCTKKKWKFRERGRKVLGFLKLQGSGLCYFNFCYLILYYYLSETVRFNQSLRKINLHLGTYGYIFFISSTFLLALPNNTTFHAWNQINHHH